MSQMFIDPDWNWVFYICFILIIEDSIIFLSWYSLHFIIIIISTTNEYSFIRYWHFYAFLSTIRLYEYYFSLFFHWPKYFYCIVTITTDGWDTNVSPHPLHEWINHRSVYPKMCPDTPHLRLFSGDYFDSLCPNKLPKGRSQQRPLAEDFKGPVMRGICY